MKKAFLYTLFLSFLVGSWHMRMHSVAQETSLRMSITSVPLNPAQLVALGNFFVSRGVQLSPRHHVLVTSPDGFNVDLFVLGDEMARRELFAKIATTPKRRGFFRRANLLASGSIDQEGKSFNDLTDTFEEPRTMSPELPLEKRVPCAAKL